MFDQAGDLGPADVTLVGNTTGAIRGSIVFDASGSSFSFIKSGAAGQFGQSPGTLAADTYTLTLRSDATNGWTDLAGNAVRNCEWCNGDYVATFIVSSPAATTRILSLPDFARGFGQTVNVPNNSWDCQ